eukprot:9490299-Pyramimonas_sp.AAC.1
MHDAAHALRWYSGHDSVEESMVTTPCQISCSNSERRSQNVRCAKTHTHGSNHKAGDLQSKTRWLTPS